MPKKPVPHPPPLFDDWKRCLFQRPPELCCIFDTNIADFSARAGKYEFHASPAVSLALFTYTMRNMAAVAQGSSDRQVAFGLNYIFNGTYSNLCHSLITAPEAPEHRHEAIRSVYDLYAHFLAHRCKPALGHLSESKADLDIFLYMLWDVSPLAIWAQIQHPTTRAWPFLDVLERVLYIPHDGCIESALHGLGHAVYGSRAKIIPSIIDRFLAATPNLHPQLRSYALAARTGQIQ